MNRDLIFFEKRIIYWTSVFWLMNLSPVNSLTIRCCDVPVPVDESNEEVPECPREKI